MVKTIDATTTDRLRRSPLYIWTVSKLRSQASLHGVNHNMPFPTALKSLFSTFSVLSKYRVPTLQNRFGKFDAAFYQKIMLSSGVFRRETASGFYPGGNVVSPRKRVAEGLCGWRHGNSFPTPQSAQSHRQMRSIPLCPKAVFYVFVFLISFTIRQQCIIIALSNFPQSYFRTCVRWNLVGWGKMCNFVKINSSNNKLLQYLYGKISHQFLRRI